MLLSQEVKIILLLTFLTGSFCFGGSFNHDETQNVKRKKRNVVFQFRKMISCATGRSFWAYLPYGCYCGLGGSGIAVDDTDRCCKTHDDCYEQINREGICFFSPLWKWYRRSGCTGCASSNDNCGRRVCECDGEAARCFARSTYNQKNKFRC
ncbi:acidic phospholipase A2 DE-II-like [Porites lutea]|uniref:acidic phospholipase A2 DE-II-like n=1 Tax=Porites lutea TaxID=51062 RepID=UPI003CC65C4B